MKELNFNELTPIDSIFGCRGCIIGSSGAENCEHWTKCFANKRSDGRSVVFKKKKR